MAFLGDFGKFFGLGSSKEVLGDVGASVGGLIGLEIFKQYPMSP